MKFDLIDKIAYSTVRIQCLRKDGTTGSGTGFLYGAHHNKEANVNVPVVITNKHVLKDAVSGTIRLCERDIDGNALDTKHVICDIPNFDELINHPDEDVDLCAFGIFGYLVNADNAAHPIYIALLNRSHIVTQKELDELSVFEEVMMVGYPNAIWDSTNNKPIFRKGMTATHANKDYCGQKEFLIDAAVYPGSSGSPVFHYQRLTVTPPGKMPITVTNARLMGIAYKVYQHSVKGKVESVDIPVIETQVAKSMIPNHLGRVIKAERILELENVIPTCD